MIQDSESRFRRLFVDNPIPMWIFDVDTLAFLDVNVAAIRQYGDAHDEFLHMTIRDIRPPEDIRQLEASVREPDSMHPEPRGIFRHRRKDGSVFEAELPCRTPIRRGTAPAWCWRWT